MECGIVARFLKRLFSEKISYSADKFFQIALLQIYIATNQGKFPT